MHSGGLYAAVAEAGGDLLSGSHPLIGITSAICGNLVISIALNVQRYAHLRIKDKETPKQQLSSGKNDDASSANSSGTYFKSRLWWLGVLLMTVGETGNFVAYGFAPASIVSPLGVLALVSNCVVAPIFFNERITRRNILGVGITVLGILLIIVSVKPPSKSSSDLPMVLNAISELHPHEFIMRAISQLPFKIYFLVVTTLAAALFFEENVVTTSSTSTVNLFANLGLVALFGAFTALSTKGLSSLINFSFPEAVRDPLTYALILILAITAVIQVIYLNRALKLFDATMVLPVHFVMFTISVIVGSAITFHDFENSDPAHVVLFSLGCVLTFIGVWLITSSSSTPEQALHHETQPLNRSLTSHPNYSSAPALEAQSLALPQSLRPVPKKSYSYSLGSSQPAASAIPVVPTSSSISYFFSQREDRSDHHNGTTTTRVSASLGSSPNYCYYPSSHSNASTPNPAAITSSGFFIGTMLQTKRSLGYLTSTATTVILPPTPNLPQVVVEEVQEEIEEEEEELLINPVRK